MRLLEKALTFDDVLLVPDYSQVLPRDTSLATKLTRDIELNLPVVSAAMDTVTEEAMVALSAAERERWARRPRGRPSKAASSDAPK